MEYDYAVETGKPVIRLLHKNPKKIADEDDEKLSKLLIFRTKLKLARMNAFWSSADQLGKEVAYALMELKKSKPAVGWVRADGRATAEAELEIFRLKEKLKNSANGDDNIPLEKRFEYRLPITTELVGTLKKPTDETTKEHIHEMLVEI